MLFFTCLFILTICGYAAGECPGGCDQPTLLYESLNCKAVFSSPEDCCPSKYDCSHIEARAASNEEKCYFRGKTYNSGEEVNNDEVYENCQISCRCRKKGSGNMGFTCAVLDCPEWLGARRLPPGCYLTYELDKCCSVGDACPPFKATCEADGKTYHEGQRFDSPNAKCTSCVCQEGFSGKFEAPFCKRNRCIDEVRRQKEVKEFCAPSYITLGDCCPFNWICPENDKIVPAATSKNPNLKCKFGTSTLNIGDKFERTSERGGKLSCECRIPPYLTCIQNYEYPAYAPEY